MGEVEERPVKTNFYLLQVLEVFFHEMGFVLGKRALHILYKVSSDFRSLVMEHVSELTALISCYFATERGASAAFA